MVNIRIIKIKIEKIIAINAILFACICKCFAAPFEYRYTSNGFKYVHHNHSESSYQHAYCTAHNGIEEYENKDKTRVDCLTSLYAIEFDFADKAYESVGQALHYGISTGKIPKIVLILDGYKVREQMVYYRRLKNIGEKYGFEVEYVTDRILNIDNADHCQYLDCKCNIE